MTVAKTVSKKPVAKTAKKVAAKKVAAKKAKKPGKHALTLSKEARIKFAEALKAAATSEYNFKRIVDDMRKVVDAVKFAA